MRGGEGEGKRVIEAGMGYKLVGGGGEAALKECPFCPPLKGLRSNEFKMYISLEKEIYHCFRWWTLGGGAVYDVGSQAKGHWYSFVNEVDPKGLKALGVSEVDPRVVANRDPLKKVSFEEMAPLDSCAEVVSRLYVVVTRVLLVVDGVERFSA